VTDGLRSAVVVAIPEAPPAVERWLEATAGAKPSHGVPPHVTILFPFVPASEIDPGLIGDLEVLARRFAPFAFDLRELRTWPDVLYLAPEPAAPFIELTEAFVAAYPAYPPYEGAHETVVPHFTVAQGEASALIAAANDVRPSLPLRARVDELLFLAEREHDVWGPVARIPLGGGRP
jgi:2'-5' RNA ligase